MNPSCFKYLNKCHIHENFTTGELLELYEKNPVEIINLIKNFLQQNQLPNFFLSFQTTQKNSIKILTCLLQLTLEYVNYGLDFETINENEFMTKYMNTFEHCKHPNVYDIYTKPKLITLIQKICSCKYDFITGFELIGYLHEQNVHPKRIELLTNNLANIVNNDMLDKIVETELKSSKLIHPYIIENFPVKTDHIEFNKENTKFMLDSPYFIYSNMIDYMIWHLSNHKFAHCNDVHYTIHTEILYVKSIRYFHSCSKYFPWEGGRHVIIDNEILNFIQYHPYNIHPNRFPIVIKELSKIDFSTCTDIPMVVYDKLIMMSEISKNINKYIIENFPSNNCDVIITIRDIVFSVGTPYFFPEIRLDLLVKLLSEIDFINCDE